MKKLLTIYLLFLATFASNASDEKPYLTKIFKASTIDALEVKTSGGGITVEGGNASEARVEVYIKGNNGVSAQEIEERLKNYTLSVEKDGSTLRCIAKTNENNMNWKKSLSISFKVFVAQNISTDLTTSGGGIAMTNLNGKLKFRTSGGGLSLKDLKGTIEGSTSGGGISLDNCDDVVNVQTSGGGILAKDCDGTIRLSTSGGGLQLKSMTGNIKATTSGGSITGKNIDGELITSTSGGSIHLDAIHGDLRASTSGGGIHVDMLSINDFVDLSTSAGSVDVHFPSNKGLNLDVRGTSVRADNFSDFNGKKEKTTMRGTVGGGGTNVKITTSSGSVNLSR